MELHDLRQSISAVQFRGNNLDDFAGCLINGGTLNYQYDKGNNIGMLLFQPTVLKEPLKLSLGDFLVLVEKDQWMVMDRLVFNKLFIHKRE